MSILPLFEWYGETGLGLTIRDSIWLFPVIECFHLLALSMLGGAILVVDMRLLGLGLRRQSVAQLARHTHPLLVASVIVMLVTGVLLAGAETLRVYYSPPFWWKMRFLGAAILFTFAVRRPIVRSHATRQAVRDTLVAVVSTGLWFGVAFSGRWIAFY